MMRKCHLNTCPVGVATQNEELRKRFSGKADNVVTFFRFLAEEVREHLAELGYRKLDDIIGRADLLERNPEVNHWKIKNLDLSPLAYAYLLKQQKMQCIALIFRIIKLIIYLTGS